jgi:hypothetical protein
MTTGHRDIDYAENQVTYAGQPVVAGQGADSDEVTVTVSCPACNGEFTTDYPRGIPQGGKGWWSWRRVPEPLSGDLVMYCECGRIHANRPESSGENGCGAYWSVTLP